MNTLNRKMSTLVRVLSLTQDTGVEYERW